MPSHLKLQIIHSNQLIMEAKMLFLKNVKISTSNM